MLGLDAKQITNYNQNTLLSRLDGKKNKMIQVLFAFIAGILTVLAPCILPMLPILLGASIGQQSKQRPLLIVCGFILSFAFASLILSALVSNLGLSANIVRDVAIFLLLIFAILMIWPKPFELLTVKMSGTINIIGQLGQDQGNMGGLILGLVLGIIWTPCAGPILGTILTLIAIQGSTGKSAVLIIFYALGAGIPMLIIAYGSRWLTTKIKLIARHSVKIQQTFGVLIVLLAVAMYFQYDTLIINKLTVFFPQNTLENRLVGQNAQNNQTSSQAASPIGSLSTAVGQNYGPAPDFTGITHWLNSNPLTMAQLKGKVVLVDFWTYSCINCIRTLPYVTAWYNKYNADGLVVIGVHTPEFEFEKDTGNVANAIKQFNIDYPVAQDNNYKTWQAYNNEYWPAEYLINKDGQIVEENFGEGGYDKTENSIRQLLGLSADKNAQTSVLGNIQSPEMYFESSRLEYIASGQIPSQNPEAYNLPDNLPLNTFALGGTWQFTGDHALLTQPNGKIKLRFSSGKVYMVAAAGSPITLKITVDGKVQPDVIVQASRLYTLFDSSVYSEHTIEIAIPDAGFQAFTFTFG